MCFCWKTTSDKGYPKLILYWEKNKQKAFILLTAYYSFMLNSPKSEFSLEWMNSLFSIFIVKKYNSFTNYTQ